VLNWNGANDTIECLESILIAPQVPLRIVVVDNGSTDDSVSQLQTWLVRKAHPFVSIPALTSEAAPAPDTSLVQYNDERNEVYLLLSESNLGFAAGNNLGLKFALQLGAENLMILNNDTTIHPKALRLMDQFLSENESASAVTPKIKYSSTPDLIWNAGGFLLPLGGRMYYLRNKEDKAYYTGSKRVSFVTGCALMIRASVLKSIGLLDERFFFGEEDYELSRRLRQGHHKTYAVLDAVILHKVSVSKNAMFQDSQLGFTLLHHLNRLLHMKSYYAKPVWLLWRMLVYGYLTLLLRFRKGMRPLGRVIRYLRLLRDFSNRLDEISRETFQLLANDFNSMLDKK